MRNILVGLALSGAILAWSGVLAEEPPSSQQQQVEQLQKQLAAMQEEMKGLRKALEEKSVPAHARATMQGHMMRMDQQWQAMHKQCCMMSPAGCPAGSMGGPGMGMGMGTGTAPAPK